MTGWTRTQIRYGGWPKGIRFVEAGAYKHLLDERAEVIEVLHDILEDRVSLGPVNTQELVTTKLLNRASLLLARMEGQCE